MTADWDSYQQWRTQIERRLFELGALIKGNLPIQADRVADCVEQIEELRVELRAVHERQDKMAEYILKKFKENGGPK
jgi:hypothetical protein